MCKMFRIGYSEDIHQLVEGRKLMLGGIHIPFELGEKAHSDGDVLIHAIAEAILGALALGDLGKHFPDNDAQYKNISSEIILTKVYELMVRNGYEINNLDTSIILERPKLSPYIDEIRLNLSALLHTEIDRISIKAGTNEGIGELGSEKAIKSIAVVLLKKTN